MYYHLMLIVYNYTLIYHTTKEENAMKFNHFIYLYLGPDLDPEVHRSDIKTEKLAFSAIGIAFNEKEKAIAVA